MNHAVKGIAIIGFLVLAGLALLTTPSLHLCIVAVVNIFVGGYTRSGWGRLVVCLIVGLALFALVRWVLMTTGSVLFSDKSFVPVF